MYSWHGSRVIQVVMILIILCSLHYNKRRLYESSVVSHRHGTYTPQVLRISSTQIMSTISSLLFSASLQNPSVETSTDGAVSNNNPKQGPTTPDKEVDKPKLPSSNRIAMVFSLIGMGSFFEHRSEKGIENYAWRKEGNLYYPAYPPTNNVPEQSIFHPTAFRSIRFATVGNIGNDSQARDVNMYWKNQNSTKNNNGQAATIIQRKSTATKPKRFEMDHDRFHSRDKSSELSVTICHQATESSTQIQPASVTSVIPWHMMRKGNSGHDADNSAWSTANFVNRTGDQQHQARQNPPEQRTHKHIVPNPLNDRRPNNYDQSLRRSVIHGCSANWKYIYSAPPPTPCWRAGHRAHGINIDQLLSSSLIRKVKQQLNQENPYGDMFSRPSHPNIKDASLIEQAKGMEQIQGTFYCMSRTGAVRFATIPYRTSPPNSVELYPFAEDLSHNHPDTQVYLASSDGLEYKEALNMLEAGESFGLVFSGNYETAGNLPDNVARAAAVSAAERLTASTHDCSRSGGSARMDLDNNSDAVYRQDSADDYVFPPQLPDPLHDPANMDEVAPSHSPSSACLALNQRSTSAAPRSTSPRPLRSEVMNPNDGPRRACPTCRNRPQTAPELYDTWLPHASSTTTLRIHGVRVPATVTITDVDHAPHRRLRLRRWRHVLNNSFPCRATRSRRGTTPSRALRRLRLARQEGCVNDLFTRPAALSPN